MAELIKQGGPVVWVLLALAFLGCYFVLERLIFFQRSRVNVGDLLIGLASHLRRKAFAEAMHEASRVSAPTARVCHAVLMRHSLPRRDLAAIAQEAGQLEVPRIENNLRAILGIATLAPLAGMLGTVLGLTQTFMEFSQQDGITSNSDLSEGVFQALITTALGLAIALPLYVFYLYFHGTARRLLHRIERTGIEIVNLVHDARGESDIVSFSEKKDEESRQPAESKKSTSSPRKSSDKSS